MIDESKKGFLTITRYMGEGVYIGPVFVRVQKSGHGRNQIRVSIKAPPEFKILREELVSSEVPEDDAVIRVIKLPEQILVRLEGIDESLGE